MLTFSEWMKALWMFVKGIPIELSSFVITPIALLFCKKEDEHLPKWLYWYDGSDKGWRYHTKQHIRGIYTAYCCSPYLSGYSDAFKPRSKQT